VRVAIVIYRSLETLSGGYLYDRKLVETLRQYGDEVQVISQPWLNYAGHLCHNLQSGWFERLKALKVDVLVQDELNHPSLFWVNSRLRGKVKYPIVSIIHHLRGSEAHPPVRLWLYRQVERAYLGGVDGFIWNSQTTRQAVEAQLGAQADGVVATPAGDRFGAGLEDAQILQRCRQERRLELLFVGNLIERKGLHTLIHALALLPGHTWKLRVVGQMDVDPAYTARVKDLVRRQALTGQVEFAGKLSEAELKTALAASDVLVMVSSYEGFGIVYLEGMGFGLPAVASHLGAAGEIIQDGVNGRLVPPDSPQELAGALAPYLERGAVLAAHSLAARRRFDAFPGWAESMQKIRSYLVSRAAAL
jgi:glycosyltransferase involved in cell wall biosynthesis